MTDVSHEIAAERRTWGPDDIIFVDDTVLVAAAEVHTGAMIALVPTQEDAQRIAVDGGEDVDQLHVTICYLGEAALIPPEVREQLVECVSECAQRLPTVAAKAFSVSVFNPLVAALSAPTEYHDALLADGGPDPCVVLGVSGSLVQRAYDVIAGDVYETLDLAGVTYPTPHSPWIPHITVLYTNEVDVSDFADRMGPINFDRVRLAFGGEVYDVPLADHITHHDGMLTSPPYGEEDDTP